MFVLLGLLIGFIAAIPLGPVNVFIISQTLKRGFFHGIMGGITAAILDTIYCLVAIIGISQITINLANLVPLLKVIAAFLLFAIGFRLFRQSKTYKELKPPPKITAISPRPVIGVFLLYVSNPSLYAFWLAVGGIVTSHAWVLNRGSTPVVFAIACGIGGILWYFILCQYVSTHHHQFQPKTFRKIFLGLAVILFIFAIYTIISLFFKVRLHL